MNDEPTEENIKELLNKIPSDTSSVERVVLANPGTVQTLLSVLFKVPIKVIVLSQTEFEGVIIRWTKLVATYSPDIEATVCLAQSVISSDNPGFITGIREKKMGIGQLISAKGLATRRRIVNFYSDESVFSRVYAIEDVGMTEKGNFIRIIITELFPKKAFEKIERVGK